MLQRVLLTHPRSIPGINKDFGTGCKYLFIDNMVRKHADEG